MHDPHTAPPGRWSELMRTAIDRVTPVDGPTIAAGDSALVTAADDHAVDDVVARATHAMEVHALGASRIRSAAIALREPLTSLLHRSPLPAYLGLPLPTPLRVGHAVDRTG